MVKRPRRATWRRHVAPLPCAPARSLVTILFLRVFTTLSLAALGGFVPLLGSRLEALGLSGTSLGLLLALLPVGRLLSAPVWGWLADRYQLGGVLLRVGAMLALAGMVLVGRAVGPAQAGAGLFLFAVGRTPLGPLVDVFIVQALARAGQDARAYGRTRLWGSVGFLAAAWFSGFWADRGHDPLAIGLALSLVCVALAFRFPAAGGGRPAPIGPALRALARQPGFWALLAFGACQALTVNVYDIFLSVHVRALGLPASVTSYAVMVGVGVEIGVMAFGQRILGHLGRRGALLLAAGTALPRWLLTAWVTDPVALVAVQLLHGTSFAVFWIAGVDEMSVRSRGSHVEASAQSLWATATYGVGALFGAALAGALREHFGTPAIFQGCAVISCFALVFAWRATPRA